MNDGAQIMEWISQDSMRMQALSIASELQLPDWCLAAGFVRNLAWDRVHGYISTTALNDIDLIYFDPDNTSEEREKNLERRLRAISGHPWSVKNQARMHEQNADSPYTSTQDAMSYWVEVETAVGAKLNEKNDIEIVAPFGVEVLLEYTITLNSKRPKPEAFAQRIQSKKWLEIWPRLVINT